MIERWKDAMDYEIERYSKKKIKNPSVWARRALIYSLEWLSVGYFSALYMAGKKFAKYSLSKDVHGKIKDAENFLKRFFKYTGIGDLTVICEKQGRYVYRIDNCSTCSGMKPVNKHICYFEAGLIAGILEAKLGKRVVVQETLCGGLGDECCEFIARVG